MTPDEFRKSGHALIDMIADYRTNVEEMPVRSQSEVGDLLNWLPDAPPANGEDAVVLLDEIATKVVPAMTHWQHPSFFAYFPANADLSTVLGDLASSGFGQLGLNWQSSPPLTEFEQRMCDWIRQLLGLTGQWHGVIQDTASTSTLVALLCAREKSTGFGQIRDGLRDEDELVVYSSSQAHSSITKAALLAGFGKNQLRACAVNADHSVDLGDLRRQLDEDMANNRKPSVIVGCTGTTATTAMDDIAGLADLAEEYGCWLHVDSAMAGSAMILPEMRHLWEGVERADSMVLNPHKWLGVVFDCSIYYVRDEQHLIRVMSTNPSYLQTAADGEAPNYRDWGIPLGRRFRAMKLWWLLRCEGADKLQGRLRRDIENARWLEQQIEVHPDWHLVAPVALQTLCVVHRPASVPEAELDDYTQAWCEAINASGEAMLTPAVVADHWIVRISIGVIATERRHVEQLWQTMQNHTT